MERMPVTVGIRGGQIRGAALGWVDRGRFNAHRHKDTPSMTEPHARGHTEGPPNLPIPGDNTIPYLGGCLLL